MSECVEFAGESFAVSERVGIMALMRFAKVAQAGADSSDMEGLAAMHSLLEQCIAEPDWYRFQSHAEKTKADTDELLDVIKEVFKILSQRPTSRPSSSSDGPLVVNERSADDSSSQVIARLEERGRPDLALMVMQAEESRASA